MTSSNASFAPPESRRRRFAPRGAGWWAAVLAIGLVPAAIGADASRFRTYTGACDASAVAPVNETLFAAASDETNVLQLYRRGTGGAPVASVPLHSFLGHAAKHEADFEAAARIGDRIYWIGSHSRNDAGEARPERHVLVATRVIGTGPTATLAPVGRPYRGLVLALSAEPALAPFEFSRGALRAGEAPGGLNIEGLAAGPDGSLWIGFRNPVPEGRAVVVPLLNPDEVTGPSPVAPRFGPPRRLDLGGLGIRDLARLGNRYLVIAGPAEGGGRHRLFTWQGADDRPIEVDKGIPKGFPAEGILVPPDNAGTATGAVELFGDEGSEKIGGRRCEDIPDPARRQFRSVLLPWPPRR